MLDFGLARHELAHLGPAGGDENTDAALTIPGTPRYMSPEQLRGEPTGPRSDIFSLGVVLYEMLAGRRPFDAPSTAETWQRVLSVAPELLVKYNPAVPGAVEKVVRKCLEKDPDRRYQSARELSTELSALERGATGPLPRFSLASWFRPKYRRFALLAAALAMAAILGVLRIPRSAQVSTLAVLPFANISGDPSLDYAAEGLSESVQRDLTRLPRLKLTASSRVQRYRGSAADPLAAGREFKVQRVLTGRLARRADDLQLTVELIDAADGTQKWAQRYRQPPTQLLDLEQELFTDLVSSIDPSLSTQVSASRGRPSNQKAYDCI